MSIKNNKTKIDSKTFMFLVEVNLKSYSGWRNPVKNTYTAKTKYYLVFLCSFLWKYLSALKTTKITYK